MSKGGAVDAKKSDAPQGTFDLMILKTLHASGPLYGFGIARRIEQLSEEVPQRNEGTLYTSLLRLPGAWLDGYRMGHAREQPQGQVLLHN
jgi:DNA-binding PadR family transcriptional regulator